MERIFRLNNYCTHDDVNQLNTMIKNHVIEPEKFTKATIVYDCDKGIPFGNGPEHYPLKFFSADESEQLWVCNVTAGYRGTGPHGTIECLKAMKFSLSEAQEEEIFTTKLANLTYYK